MNVPEVLVNLVDVFVIMRRFHVQDKVYRVIEELSETGGMEQKTVLLSHIYKYDLAYGDQYRVPRPLSAGCRIDP